MDRHRPTRGSAAWIPRLSYALFGALVIFACSKSDAPGSDGASSSGTSGFSSGSSGTSGGQGTSSGTVDEDGSNGGPPKGVTITTETIEFGGLTRMYILAVPKHIVEGKSYPLVLSFHGNPGTAQFQAEVLPFETVSNEDAVIVYPQGDGDNWDLYTATENNADMPFMEALVPEIEKKAPMIDKSRVFGFGYSGGGFFITQMACRFGFFKAIAVVSGGGPDEPDIGGETRPSGCLVCAGGAIPTLVIHGMADTEVVPESGDFTANCFAEGNECSDTRSAADPSPCETYDGCPTDKPVKRCMIPDLGHGPWDQSMDAAWSFFQAVP